MELVTDELARAAVRGRKSIDSGEMRLAPEPALQAAALADARLEDDRHVNSAGTKPGCVRAIARKARHRKQQYDTHDTVFIFFYVIKA